MKTDPTHASPNPLRRRLMLALPGGLIFATPVAMVACGGSGEDAPVGGPQVQGQMVLPTGINASDVTVVGNTDEVQPAAADGKFTLAVADDSLTLVAAVHSSERALHYGLVRAGLAGQTLDARSSAATLLFVSLGASQLAPADRRAVYEAIAADTQTATLAVVIQARIDANPFALDEPDAQIVSALQLSLQALRSRAATAPSGRVRRLAANDVQPLLRIEPGGEVNGISVNQDGDTPGYSIVNTKRRRGIAHLYKVGYQLPDAPRVDLALAEASGDRLEISSTQSLGVFNALADIVNATAPFSPVTSSRVPLTMHAGAEQTFYEVVYVTPVYDSAEPAFFSEARYSLQRQTWLGELSDLYERAQMEIVFGAILEALGMGGAAINEAAFALALANLRAAAAADVSGVFAVAAQTRNGVAYLQGIRGWVLGMAGAPGRISILSAEMLPCVAPLAATVNPQMAANMAARSLSRARLTMFHGAMRVMSVAFVVAGVFDTAAQYKDLHSGEKASLFAATLVGPKVFVSPSSGKVSKGKEQQLTARVTGAQGVTLTYRWTLTGSSLANLSDRAGKIGTTIDTDSATVVLATTPSTVGTLTITVEAFQVKASGNRSLGTATSQLVMDDTVVQVAPETARIERVGGSQLFTFSIAPAPAETLSYEWTCPSQYGTLTSGGVSTSAAQPTITSAQPTATYAGRAGLDGGESETLRCTAFSTHPDPTTGATVRVDAGTATAEVAIKQKFNIEMLSVPAEVPSDSSIGISARITDAIPAGATVTWTWSHSGAGSIATVAGDANKPNSSVSFSAGASEGLASFSVSARVVLADGTATPVLPVTRSTQVKKGLKQIVMEVSGGVFGCTDPLACGVTEYTAFIVPRFSKATGYTAVLSGYAYAGCNRSVSWSNTLLVGDRGGCDFPVSNHPHTSAGATNAFAVWIGFGGPISGKCVVTITLNP